MKREKNRNRVTELDSTTETTETYSLDTDTPSTVGFSGSLLHTPISTKILRNPILYFKIKWKKNRFVGYMVHC